MSETDSFVKFKKVDKSYDGEILVVKDLNLDVAQGEFLTLLGPSGSGKTTILMMLAGFETPTNGEIYLDGEAISNIPPYKRKIGMVFQNYALFPHMTVYENLSFPLKVRKVSKDEIDKKINKALSMVSLTGFETRMPGQLSGGQQQRVAVARALVFDPKLVLMDEPLGALDKNLRESMQYELKHIHESLGVTVVYVTHDQGEALTMSDRVAVMNEGELEQVGLCGDVYDYPNTPFVATFVGENNPFHAKVLSVDKNLVKVESKGNTFLATAGKINEKQNYSFSNGDEVIMFIRPESIFIKNENNKLDNVLSAKVVTIEFEGNLKNIYLKMESNMNVRFSVPNAVDTSELSSNKEVELTFSSQKAIVLPKGALAVD